MGGGSGKIVILLKENHPTLVELGTALGLTEAELDMMFINASKL